MKKINQFLETSSPYTIFSFRFIFFLIIGLLISTLFALPDSLELIQILPAFIISLLFVGVEILVDSMCKSSDAFWRYAREIENLIENAETKDELQTIYNNEFQKLVKMQMGKTHSTMLVKLDSTLTTKYKYIK